jgi:serine/threonine protein kinase
MFDLAIALYFPPFLYLQTKQKNIFSKKSFFKMAKKKGFFASSTSNSCCVVRYRNTGKWENRNTSRTYKDRIFQDDHYFGPSVDIWALGILLFFMVTGAMPFKGSTVAALKHAIIECKFEMPGKFY